MKTIQTKTNILNTRVARASSLLTVGLAILGPGMKLPKAWADAPAVSSVGAVGDVSWSNNVDWSAAGADYTVLSPFFTLPVTSGLSLTASTPTGAMERRTQQASWMGCFEVGEALLWKHDDFDLVAEPITVSFSSPVLAVGAKIQNDAYGEYTGWIQAFDIDDQLIGSYSASADACFCSNGDAAFVGIQANLPVISYVKFGVNNSDSFAIGHLNILAGEGEQLNRLAAPAPVPEAGPVAAAGVFGLLLVRWVFFRKTEDASV
jgi:hypothetical protein